MSLAARSYVVVTTSGTLEAVALALACVLFALAAWQWRRAAHAAADAQQALGRVEAILERDRGARP